MIKNASSVSVEQMFFLPTTTTHKEYSMVGLNLIDLLRKLQIKEDTQSKRPHSRPNK